MTGPLMPDRQEARYWKGDKIWTEVSVTISGNPLHQLRSKYNAVVDALPFKLHWIHYNPKQKSNNALSGGYYGACIGLTSLNDHLQVIQTLCQLYERDHKAFDSVVVIDARREIIGDLPDDEHAPSIPMDDIISGRRFHRTAGDDADFAPPPPDKKKDEDERGIPMYVSADFVHQPCKAYKVSQSDLTFLNFYHDMYYPTTVTTEINTELKPLPLMSIVHMRHAHFVKSSPNITREQYNLSIEAYKRDKTIRPATKKKLKDRLQRRYSVIERKRYGLKGAPKLEWLADPFADRMNSIYDEHYKMMDREHYKIDHVAHKKWQKIYEEDPIMEDDWNTSLQALINEKFSMSLFDYENDPDEKHVRAMFRYWVNEIPVKTPIFKPFVPYDCLGYCPDTMRELVERDRSWGLWD